MTTSLLLPLVLRAAEEGGHSGPNPWVIGLITLGLLVGMMAALLSFGGGREHT